MNPADYDEDGNNIVPCPMCLSDYNPCKEGGKCPAEYSFRIETEVRLLLDEFEATGDRSRVVNVMEAVDNELEKAVEAERERVVQRLKDIGERSDFEQALTPTNTDKQTEV